MAEYQRDLDMSHVMRGTTYCWPVLDYHQLRIAASSLKTRITVRDDDVESHTVNFADLVDTSLRSYIFTESIISTDDTGHTVLFIGLNAPLPQMRIKHLSQFNEEPLLLAVLLPELAFNLSEVGEVYHFSIQESLEEQYATTDISPYIIEHNGTIYTTMDATFQILNREYPALLIPLGFSFLFKGDRQPAQVHEILKDATESLRLLETRLTDGAFEVISPEVPQLLVDGCFASLSDCQSAIIELLNPEADEHISVRHTLTEAIHVILEEEKSVIKEMLPPTIIQDPMEDPMEIDIEAAQEPLIDSLHTIFRCMRRARRTLYIMRHAIPTD